VWRRFSEEERQAVWDMREAGVPVKRIARYLGRQNVSVRKFSPTLAGSGQPLGNAPSYGSPSKSARRSLVDWRQVTPSAPSLSPSTARPRRCVGK
jgi:transposase-like protein